MVEYPNYIETNLQKYMYLKELEKEVKDEIKSMQIEIKNELGGYENNFVSGENGSLQKITKKAVKPKDSLTMFLHDQGLLEICKNDGIDLQKVNQLVDAGVIDEEELQQHLDIRYSDYLKFNPKK